MALTLWFVDAILFKATNFAVDAITVQSIHDEFKFSDVHLQDVLHLDPGPFTEFLVDAQAILRPDNNFLLDGLLNKTDKEFAFQVDANAQIMPSQNYSVDAFIEQETDLGFAVDGIVVSRPNLFWIADTIISSRLLNQFTIDPITLGTLDLEYEIDSFLQELNKETTFTCDSSADRRTVPIVDAFIIALNQEVGIAVDAIVINRKLLTFQVDASVQKDGFKPFNIDAFILKETDDDSTVDAQVVTAIGEIDICTVHFCTSTQPALFFTLDAITPFTFTHEFNLDSHLEAQGTFVNYSVDALLTFQRDHNFTLDVFIIKPSQFNACPSIIRQSLNCQSVIRRRGT